MNDAWQVVLVGGLALNAALGLGYRAYRLTKGGPLADVLGQAILAVILGLVAVGVAVEWGPARWIALGYGLLFGVIVMPIWTLAVLIPLPPGATDYAFTIVYWAVLVAIAVAALLV